MRALITGARGFAGTHLAQLLEQDGHEVTGLVGDVRDWQTVSSAVTGTRPDMVFHLAAMASPAAALADPRKAVDVAVGGTFNILEAVRTRAPAARVLIAGSSAEYGPSRLVLSEGSACRPDGPYGAAKLSASALGMAWGAAHGLHVVVTRAWMHTGPGARPSSVISRMASQVAAIERGERDFITCPDPAQRYDLLDVRDVVAAYRLAIDAEPGVWNVCRGGMVSLREIGCILLRLSSLDNLTASETPGLRRDMPPGSAAKLRAATGWEPKIPLEQTLGDLLDHWRRLWPLPAAPARAR